jgi:hypothetical protein
MSTTDLALKTALRGSLLAAALGTALFAAAPASAATFNVSGNIADGTYGSFFIGTDPYQTYKLLLPVDAFTLTSGDQITVNVTLDQPLIVPSGNQFVGINLETLANPTTIQDNGTMTFTGGAGAPVGPQGANFSGGFSNVVFLQGPAFSFQFLFSDSIITFDGDPITIDALSISYQVDNPPLATPLPAALPLFATGLGVIGVLARRRKQKASTQAQA